MSGIDTTSSAAAALEGFAPDDVGVANGRYFGLPFSVEQSQLVLLSAPWDVTVSYGAGTAGGPQAILEASTQVELRDEHYPEGWRQGIGTLEVDPWIMRQAPRLRRAAARVIAALEKGVAVEGNVRLSRTLEEVNRAGEELNKRIRVQAASCLATSDERVVGLVGGDHSTPLGLMQAVGAARGMFGILHIDAHADLREAYEGFAYSHASIMHNALQIPQVQRLVQVGIRDFSMGEAERAAWDERIVQFDDYQLARNAFEGLDWATQCTTIVEKLPEQVYISFDIDGLSPDNCPGTGTPVPGGLSFHQAVYLLVRVAESGRRIVGFDLTEVAPTTGDSEWNANIGARVLYKLCNVALLSQKK